MEFNKVIFSDTSARKYKKSLNKKETISRVKNDSKNEIKLPETASIVVIIIKIELRSSCNEEFKVL